MKKPVRIITWAVAIVLLLVLLALAFLPALVSSGVVRRTVLARASTALDARIEVGHWSFSWRGPIEIRSVRSEASDASWAFDLDRLTVSEGLWHIARARAAGDIDIDAPRLVLRLPEPAAPEPEPPHPPAPPPPRAPDPRIPPEPPPPPATWPDMSARIRVRGGALVVEQGDRRLAMTDIAADIDLRPDPASLTFELSGRAADADGRFRIHARIEPDAARTLDPERLRGTASATVSDWNLAPLGPWSEAANGPNLEGRLALDTRATIEPGLRVVTTGRADLAGIRLSGAVLRGDEPDLGDGSVEWDLAQIGDRVDVRHLQGALGPGRMSAHGVVGPDDFIEGSVNAQIDLAAAARLIPRMLGLRDNLELEQGVAAVTVQADRAEDRMLLAVRARVDDIAGRVEDQPVALSAPIDAQAEILVGAGEWEIQSLTFSGSPGRIEGAGRIADWATPEADWSGRIEIDLGLARLLDALQGLEGVQSFAGTDGRLQVRAEAGTTDHGLDATVEAELSALRLPLADDASWEEPRIALSARVRQDADGVDISSLALSASFLEMTWTDGRLQAGDEPRIRGRGRLSYDLAAAGSLLAALAGDSSLHLEGRADRPFEFDLPLGADWLESGQADASFALARMDGMGLAIADLEMGLFIRDAEAALSLDGSIEGGRLRLEPRLNRVDGRLMLTLPDGTEAIRGAQLTDELADVWLARLHPIFRGSAVTDGSIHLHFDRFRAPLEAEAGDEIVFSGTLFLEDVELSSSGLLDRVRELARLREGRYRIGTHALRFRCADGRIETDPLRVTVSGHPIEFSGSTGLDESLAYTVRTPVSERLVGREAYAVLSGEHIEIPIRGTVSAPRLGEQELRDAVGALIRRAGTESIRRGAERLLRQLRDP